MSSVATDPTPNPVFKGGSVAMARTVARMLRYNSITEFLEKPSKSLELLMELQK
jgi:hypothetical protein